MKNLIILLLLSVMACFALSMQNSGGKIEVGQYINLLEQQDFSSVQEAVEYNVVAQDSIVQHKTINFIAYRYKPLTGVETDSCNGLSIVIAYGIPYSGGSSQAVVFVS